MMILEGSYVQDIGFASQSGLDIIPDILFELKHTKGQSYHMNHPWIWHKVKPNLEPLATLMITHIPQTWDQIAPKSNKQLRCLNDNELDIVFEHFGKIFCT